VEYTNCAGVPAAAIGGAEGSVTTKVLLYCCPVDDFVTVTVICCGALMVHGFDELNVCVAEFQYCTPDTAALKPEGAFKASELTEVPQVIIFGEACTVLRTWLSSDFSAVFTVESDWCSADAVKDVANAVNSATDASATITTARSTSMRVSPRSSA